MNRAVMGDRPARCGPLVGERPTRAVRLEVMDTPDTLQVSDRAKGFISTTPSSFRATASTKKDREDCEALHRALLILQRSDEVRLVTARGSPFLRPRDRIVF